MRRMSILAAVAVLAAAASANAQQLPADATFAYAWYRDGANVTGTTVGGLAPGSTVSLDLFLFGTSASGTQVLADEGLAVGGARVTFAPGDVSVSGVEAITFGGPAGGPAANYDPDLSNGSRDVDTGGPDPFAQFAATVPVAGPAAAVAPSGPAAGGVYLATVAFQVSAAPSGTPAVVTASRTPAPQENIFTFANGFALDGVTAPASVTLAPVPEPGLVLGVAAVGLGAARVVRRRRVG